jgi:hypothetical protein
MLLPFALLPAGNAELEPSSNLPRFHSGGRVMRDGGCIGKVLYLMIDRVIGGCGSLGSV